MGDIGEVLPGRISECIVDSVPVGKHHQPLTVRTEQRALEVLPELYSGQMVAVLFLTQQFQLQFIDRFVDVQVVLRTAPLVNLNGIWDQKLSSGSVLVTFMTIHLYQLRSAGTEQY